MRPDDRTQVYNVAAVGQAEVRKAINASNNQLSSLGNSNMSSRNSPEPYQTDREGHYIGPSSGLSFLLRAQKRLRAATQQPTDTSIFTFGDTFLPKQDCSFLVLPTKAEAYDLLASYFDFTYQTHRFLHQPTVEQWLHDFYATYRQSSPSAGSRERHALVLIILAHAKMHVRIGSEEKPDTEGR